MCVCLTLNRTCRLETDALHAIGGTEHGWVGTADSGKTWGVISAAEGHLKGEATTDAVVRTTITHTMWCTLLYFGFETCFGPLYSGFETCFGPKHVWCWDPIAKHISNPEFGAILIHNVSSDTA